MKKALRKQVLSARDRLPPEERVRKSREIEQRLFHLPDFQSSHTVMFFASFRSEVDTLPIIRRALAEGKRVILPKVKGQHLELFEIRDFDDDVAPGAWGIPEPTESTPARLGDIDLMIVPGGAFDCSGNRMGYGCGYYDKILPLFKKTTIALAFELQIVPEVLTEPHDVPVKKIITEKRIITTEHAAHRQEHHHTV